MAFPQGIAFRTTAGFVTDPANYAHETRDGGANGGADYPWTTAQGNNVGWETTTTFNDGRDVDSGVDARIAGTNFNSTTANCVFRVDLTSTGSWNIGFGAGGTNYAQQVAYDLYDGTTNLVSLSTGSTSASHKFKDATNTEYSAAAWPGSQTLITKTFATTICRFQAVGLTQIISEVYLESAGVIPTFVVSTMTIPLPAPRRTQIIMI